MTFTKRKRFGLMLAGVGAGISAIALIAGTLDLPLIIASTILVIAGIIIWFTA